MGDPLSFDWFILLLRLLFIGLLYFFLFQIVRVTTRELTTIAGATAPTATSGPRPVGRLTILEPAESGLPVGASFSLESINVIGRLHTCDLLIDEPFISGEHAELSVVDGRWWLRDLGSTNGTFLNDRPVTVPTGVRSGDVVQFGRIKLQFSP